MHVIYQTFSIPIEKSTLCFNLEEFDFFFFSFVKQYMLCIHFWYTIIIAIKTTKYIHVFINMTLLWSKIGKIWVCSAVPILKCYLFWLMGVWKKQALIKKLHNIQQCYTVPLRAVLNKCSRNAIYTHINWF